MTRILISSFHPPAVELPDVDPIPAGEVAIELPALNVVFGAMDLLPEYKVSGKLPGYGVTFTFTEPMPRETAAAMVAAMLAELERMHTIVQEAFDKRGPLYGHGQLPPALLLQAYANSMGAK